jgi:hypothetical protein
MNTQEPIDEPLDPNERELARVLRALPAGEPPAALDARILKAASDALAASARRRRFAWLGTGSALWSIGSAAAAVLAIGIAWKTVVPPTRTLPATPPAPVAADTAVQEGVPVEFKEEAPRSYDIAPPPADDAIGRADAAASQPAPAQKQAPSAPAAFSEPALDEHVANNIGFVADAPAEPPAPATAAARAQVQSAETTAMPAASSGAAPSRERAEEQALAKSARDLADLEADARLSQQRQKETETLDRVQSDTRRYPESWLLKIRARRQEGDIEGARASLRLFVAKYPRYAVPDDLQALLRE